MSPDDEEGYGPEAIKIIEEILPEPMSREMRLHLDSFITPENEKSWFTTLELLHRQTPHEKAARILARGPRGFQLSEEEKTLMEKDEA